LKGGARWYAGNVEETGLMYIQGKCKNIYSGIISNTPSASGRTNDYGTVEPVSTDIDKPGYKEAEVWNQGTIVDIKLKESNNNTLSFFTNNAKNGTIGKQGPMETWNKYDVKYYNCENGKIMGIRGRGNDSCYNNSHEGCHQVSLGFNCGDVSIK
jgi:hypothetical protein